MTIETARKMNMIGIIAWSFIIPLIALVYLYMFARVSETESRAIGPWLPSAFIITITCIICIGAMMSILWTRRALSPYSSYTLKRNIIWVNWTWFGFGCLFALAALSLHQGKDLFWIFLLFIVPQWLNITALRSAMAIEVPSSNKGNDLKRT